MINKKMLILHSDGLPFYPLTLNTNNGDYLNTFYMIALSNANTSWDGIKSHSIGLTSFVLPKQMAQIQGCR